MTMPGPMGAGSPSPVHYGRAVGDWQIGARYAVRGDLHLHHAGGEIAAQVAVWRFRGTQPLPRFLEALAADLDGWSRLRHGNLSPLLDVGRIQGELTCYWVQEATGQKLLSEALANGQTLDPTRALHVALQLGHALVEVHRGGLVHGDLDPANVGLSGTNDRVRLSWGGLATRIESAGMDTGRGTTRSSAEMAPETGTGIFTPAADIFSLAALLHRMLVGSGPFESEGTEINGLEARDRLVLPSYVPADLVSLLAHSLRRDPASRPPLPDFLNVLIDVERRMTGMSADSTPDSLPSQPVAAPPPSGGPAGQRGNPAPGYTAPPPAYSGQTGTVPPAAPMAAAPTAPGHFNPAPHAAGTLPPPHYPPVGAPTGPGLPGSPTAPPVDRLPPPQAFGHHGEPRIIGAQSMTKPPPPPLFTPSRQPAPQRSYDPSLGNHPSSYTMLDSSTPGRTVQPSLAPPSSYQVAAAHPPGYRPRRSMLSTIAVGSAAALFVLVLVAAGAAVVDSNSGEIDLARLFGGSPAPEPVDLPIRREPAPPPAPVDPTLTLYSQPSRATVLEDGEPIGITPLKVPLFEAEQTRTFVLQLDGYKAAEVVQDFVDGTPVQHIRLDALGGGPTAAPARRPRRRAAAAPKPAAPAGGSTAAASTTPKAAVPAAATPPEATAPKPTPPAAAVVASPVPEPAAPDSPSTPADDVGPSAPPKGLRTTRSPGASSGD